MRVLRGAVVLLLVLSLGSCGGGLSNQDRSRARYHLYVDRFPERNQISTELSFVGDLGSQVASQLAEDPAIFVERGTPGDGDETDGRLPVLVLTGTVSWSGRTATVSVRLSEGPGGGSIWSRRYQETLTNQSVSQMQRSLVRDVAGGVADAVRGRVF